MKYTAAELAAMKGPDRTLPGYTATFGDLAEGMVVQVSVGKRGGDLQAYAKMIYIVDDSGR